MHEVSTNETTTIMAPPARAGGVPIPTNPMDNPAVRYGLGVGMVGIGIALLARGADLVESAMRQT